LTAVHRRFRTYAQGVADELRTHRGKPLIVDPWNGGSVIRVDRALWRAVLSLFGAPPFPRFATAAGIGPSRITCEKRPSMIGSNVAVASAWAQDASAVSGGLAALR
jgi:hypothetical protein